MGKIEVTSKVQSKILGVAFSLAVRVTSLALPLNLSWSVHARGKVRTVQHYVPIRREIVRTTVDITIALLDFTAKILMEPFLLLKT
jgi:hypothetical protein